MLDTAVIGGGASGLAAAITAMERGKTVCVFEREEKIGRKLLATGNGKCNLSNLTISMSDYNTSFNGNVLCKNSKVENFFDKIGLKTRIMDGRIYPYSESANTVVNLLRNRLPSHCLKTSTEIVTLVKRADGFILNNSIAARTVVLCTGSGATMGKNSHFLAEQLGLNITELSPALTPLLTDTEFIKGLSGVRAKCEIRLSNDERILFVGQGEILFKDNGVSGIVVMDASRFLSEGNNVITVDFAPNMEETELAEFAEQHGEEGIFHAAITRAITRKSRPNNSQSVVEGRTLKTKAEKLPTEKTTYAADKRSFIANKNSHINSVDLETESFACETSGSASNSKIFAHTAKNFVIENVRKSGFAQAQVTQGGIANAQFDERMECITVRGLFACGEVLDVDGRCGGFNLHWAFLSGILAGENV